MNNLWRKSFMAGILSVSLTAGAVTPAFASAAPDGKTDAASLAGGMGISRNWESWKAEWEAVKNDWTQVSLTPGSDFSQLNFAWYSKKDNSDTAEKKEEQAAQEFSAQSGDAFSDSSESVFAGTEADTSAAGETVEAAQAEETESNAATEVNTAAETAIAEEDIASEESIAAFNAEEGENAAAFSTSENDAEEFAAEANSDENLPDFDTESDESRAIAAMVADILGVQADTTAPKLIIGEGRNMKNAKVYVTEQTDATTNTKTNEAYVSNKVTATGLSANTVYYYSYEKEDGTYTEPAEYATKSTNNYSFIFVGDPQIGSSNELKGSDTAEFYQAQSDAVRNDSFNWNTTLNEAMDKTGGNASFVVSAGDQIQTTKKKSPGKSEMTSEIEYTGYLSPDVLKSLPVATTVGNHDADNANYTYHFNTPNSSDLGSNGVVGGDYYFTYGNTLFMMLNTQDTNAAEHKQFMEQAIAANPNCTWRVVTLHQDIYGSAEHSNEPEITNLRYTLVPYFEANDVDVVLTGHDHAYSRTHILEGGHKTVEYTDDEFDAELDKDMDAGENPATRYEAPANISADSKEPADVAYLNYLNAVMDKDAIEDTEKGETVVNPDGILYMTANSSSGSKYYDLVPRMQSYIANRWQEDVPTYSVIDVTDNTFTINTYRTDNDQKIDETFTIKKGVTEDIKSASVGKVKNQIYTGKQIQPALKVTLNGKTLKAGKDYTVTYTDNKNTGLAKATINGIGKYTGTQTVTFKIVPKKAVLKTVKAGKSGTATVTIGKAGGKVSGYAIQVSTDSSFKKVTTYRTAKTTYTLKNLSKGKTYYVRVKAFTKVSDKNVYGAASKTIKVKAK